MEGDLVKELPSDQTNDASDGQSVTRKRYEDAFIQQFPYYLSIGMTDKQYWDGDCALVKYYREAEKLRRERVNQEAWLQGMYIYDGLSRISPILQAFAKKGTKAQPYVEQPYPLTRKRAEEIEEKKEQEKANKGLRYMMDRMATNNKRFERK